MKNSSKQYLKYYSLYKKVEILDNNIIHVNDL